MPRTSPFHLLLVSILLPIITPTLQGIQISNFDGCKLLWLQRDYSQWGNASPTTDVHNSGKRNTIYNFGIDATFSEAGALYDCLAKDINGAASSTIEEVTVGFTLAGEPAPIDHPIDPELGANFTKSQYYQVSQLLC